MLVYKSFALMYKFMKNMLIFGDSQYFDANLYNSSYIPNYKQW